MKKVTTILLIAAGSWLTPASAETINCTAITAVPVTLTTPGVYCLTGNINTKKGRGFAIRIGADNVVIDLNGFNLRNTRGPVTIASGIFARDKENIVIRNGTIEGFHRGIYLAHHFARSAALQPPLGMAGPNAAVLVGERSSQRSRTGGPRPCRRRRSGRRSGFKPALPMPHCRVAAGYGHTCQTPLP